MLLTWAVEEDMEPSLRSRPPCSSPPCSSRTPADFSAATSKSPPVEAGMQPFSGAEKQKSSVMCDFCGAAIASLADLKQHWATVHNFKVTDRLLQRLQKFEGKSDAPDEAAQGANGSELTANDAPDLQIAVSISLAETNSVVRLELQQEDPDFLAALAEFKRGRCEFTCCLCDAKLATSLLLADHIQEEHASISHKEYFDQYGKSSCTTKAKMRCKICRKNIPDDPGYLRKHLVTKHTHLQLEDYFLQYEYFRTTEGSQCTKDVSSQPKSDEGIEKTVSVEGANIRYSCTETEEITVSGQEVKDSEEVQDDNDLRLSWEGAASDPHLVSNLLETTKMTRSHGDCVSNVKGTCSDIDSGVEEASAQDLTGEDVNVIEPSAAEAEDVTPNETLHLEKTPSCTLRDKPDILDDTMVKFLEYPTLAAAFNACMYECAPCRLHFDSRLDVLKHLKVEHDMSPEEHRRQYGPLLILENYKVCEICGNEVLQDALSFQNHLLSQHQINLLQYHRLLEEKDDGFAFCNLFKCLECDGPVLTDKDQFSQHLKDAHQMTLLKYKRLHESIYLVQTEQPCVICSRIFQTSRLLHHVLNYHHVDIREYKVLLWSTLKNPNSRVDKWQKTVVQQSRTSLIHSQVKVKLKRKGPGTKKPLRQSSRELALVNYNEQISGNVEAPTVETVRTKRPYVKKSQSWKGAKIPRTTAESFPSATGVTTAAAEGPSATGCPKLSLKVRLPVVAKSNVDHKADVRASAIRAHESKIDNTSAITAVAAFTASAMRARESEIDTSSAITAVAAVTQSPQKPNSQIM